MRISDWSSDVCSSDLSRYGFEDPDGHIWMALTAIPLASPPKPQPDTSIKEEEEDDRYHSQQGPVDRRPRFKRPCDPLPALRCRAQARRARSGDQIQTARYRLAARGRHDA